MRGCTPANTRERGNARTHARTRYGLCTLFAIMRSLHRPGSRRSSNKESKDKQPYMDGWTNTLSHESHTAPAGPATCVLRAYVRGAKPVESRACICAYMCVRAYPLTNEASSPLPPRGNYRPSPSLNKHHKRYGG